MPRKEYAYYHWTMGEYAIKERGHTVEHCAKCLRHETEFHRRAGTECSNCMPARSVLKRCAACKIVAYCSKECQRTHWSQHAGYCKQRVVQMNKMDIVMKRGVWVAVWSDEHFSCLQAAAQSAIRLAPRNPSEHYVCIVYVDVDVLRENPEGPAASSAVSFFPRIRDVRCGPLSEIRAVLDTIYRASGGAGMTAAGVHAEIDVELAPCTYAVPVVVVDLVNTRHAYEYGVHFFRQNIEDKIEEGADISGWLARKSHGGCLAGVAGLSEEVEDLSKR
ncbi:hypothetical protein BV25DRAFT_1364741 [Artomyces pyxidatus]|uniref:Uncharacterized protein n=1 Tax=Artomyces pyxidatus TaxID=48021 RepID=A0ACB8SNW6_9AGAM|nr:hypothetical protein BV25DRAFT_1364741 [Artomyces pyxidatus]